MTLHELLDFSMQSFWHFIGVLVLLGGIGRWIYNLYSRALRHFSIMKHGYPPNHCNGDGEFKREEIQRSTNQ